MMLSVLLFGLIRLTCSQEVTTITLMFVIEEGQENLTQWFDESLTSIKTDDSYAFKSTVVTVAHRSEDATLLCDSFGKQPSIIIDATWTGNEEASNITSLLNLPYVRIDLSISPVLELLDKYLSMRNSTDVVVIFEDAQIIDQALYYWIDSTRLRMIMSDKLDQTSAKRIKNLIPIPNSYAIVASSSNMANILQLAIDEKLLRLPERWNLVFLDFLYASFPKDIILKQMNIMKLDENFCCELLNEVLCNCPDEFPFQKRFLDIFIQTIVDILIRLSKDGKSVTRVACGSNKGDTVNLAVAELFYEFLALNVSNTDRFREFRDAYRLNIKASVIQAPDKTVAKYDVNQELIPVEGMQIKPVRPYYRVGISRAIPWTYLERDPKTRKLHWTGYCIDFIAKLAEAMDFDYELVVPKRGTFGEKDENGKWDGIVGDIASGETDLAIGAVVMRADREEVVDYVAPYFEISGISIVMRKPLRKTSLFRFMTVLKLEVWLSIVGALIITSFMMWFIDKYSPFSAQNNKTAYPYECREFSLKECFWFALTSFTPQGGGEAPKSLSARTLVTAYWLFVVLMLATFTANLAAFLTVERMQTPVQNLEQLARQSRINYTVVEGSDSHEYFINMKFAEDTLYRMWKELTLNASTDDVRYRVWDYPIREQYGHILLAINESNPVPNATEGFRLVNERTDGDFAFIHDSSEIKYEISRNCNFTEIGEVFAEKPYAVIVQQGSHLTDIIGTKILDMQKDRFFEAIHAKYWNNSKRGDCPSEEDSEGITLESLGGVFIATLFGLAIAMVTLGFEVLYYKRQKKDVRNVKPKTVKQSNSAKLAKPIKVYPNTVTIGTEFKPVDHRSFTTNLSNLSLYPRKKINE